MRPYMLKYNRLSNMKSESIQTRQNQTITQLSLQQHRHFDPELSVFTLILADASLVDRTLNTEFSPSCSSLRSSALLRRRMRIEPCPSSGPRNLFLMKLSVILPLFPPSEPRFGRLGHLRAGLSFRKLVGITPVSVGPVACTLVSPVSNSSPSSLV